VIRRLDGHLLLHPDLVVELLDLLDLLDLLAEVLRYDGDDLRDDIAERFHPRMHARGAFSCRRHRHPQRRVRRHLQRRATPRGLPGTG
jgi:hypothetical protein